MIGQAGASWNDGLEFVWPERFTVTNLGKLRLLYNIGATGGVSGTTYSGSGSALAAISYGLAVGSATAAGRQNWDGEKTNISPGWDSISGSIEVTPTAGGSNDYSFPSISLSISGSAAARAIHYYNAQPTNSTAIAEFGTTLIWLGIVSAQAFDTSGRELVLPEGFEVGLVGSQTGMDYWDAAVRHPVPEPGTWALLLAGLGLLGARLRGRG